MSDFSFFKNGERGEGKLSLIVTLAILGLLGLAAFQIVPALYERYEVGLALEWAQEHATLMMNDEEILPIVAQSFRHRKLASSFDPQKTRITRDYNKIALHYQWVVNLGIPGTPVTYPVVFSITR